MTIEISPEALGKLLGKSPSEVSDLFTKDGESIPAEDAGRVLNDNVNTKINAIIAKEQEKIDKKGIRDRARKELQAEFNQALLSAGAEGENWKEQLDSLVKSPKKVDITESDIKNSDFFRNTVKDLKDQIAAKETEFTDYKKSIKESENKSLITDFVLDLLGDEKNGYDVPEKENVAKTRLRNFTNELLSGEKGRLAVVDGKVVAVDSEGRTLQDENYNDLTATQFANSIAENYYVKSSTPPKKAPKVNPPSGGDPEPIVNPGIKSEADLQKHIDKMVGEGKTSSEIQAYVDNFEQNVKPKIEDWQ